MTNIAEGIFFFPTGDTQKITPSREKTSSNFEKKSRILIPAKF